MKAILEFELPEDGHDYEMAINGYKFHSCLWDLDQSLRSKIKYEQNYNEIELELLQKIRDELYDLMNSYNINFDM